MTASTKIGQRPVAWQDRLAHIMTEVMAPVVLAYALCLVVAVATSSSVIRGVVVGGVSATFIAGIPYALILHGVRRRIVSDRHVANRQQRPAILLLALVSACLGFVALIFFDAPREVLAVVGASAVGVSVAAAISLFWKISVHVAAAAGTVATLTVMFGPPALPLVPLVIALGWARVRAGDHDLPQVLWGAAIGALVAGAVMAASI